MSVEEKLSALELALKGMAAFEARLLEVEYRLKIKDRPEIETDWQPNPFRYLDRLSIPKSAMEDLVKAVGDKAVRDIVGDHIKPK